MKWFATSFAFFITSVSAAAHPHIFVDTGLDLYFDGDGKLSKVQVTWRYDAFYSLLITEDFAIDLDGDGVLTPAEQKELHGFDMNWSVGFDGDLSLLSDGRPAALSGPKDYSAAYVLGRITTTHTRDVLSDVRASDVMTLRPFDPSYYTAYDISFPITVHGIKGCDAMVETPKQTAALSALQRELSSLGMENDPADIGLENIGAVLATSVNVTCAAS